MRHRVSSYSPRRRQGGETEADFRRAASAAAGRYLVRPSEIWRLSYADDPMNNDPGVLTTPRLRLRLWRDEDLEPFAALNADPRVREFFPSIQTHQESAQSVRVIRDHFEQRGFGLWAVEVIGGAPFIGLAVPSFNAPFTPCVELGYRLAFKQWGHGYATEGSRAALSFGFSTVGLAEIVAMAAAGNERSRRVLERVGMRRNAADDFDHPNIAAGHPLRRHVLYRLTAHEWVAPTDLR